MKKGLKITLIIIILGGLAGAYYYFHPKRALAIIIPEFEHIENVHISFLEDTALIHADIQFRNKSFFKLNVDSLIYHVKLDTLTLLAKGQDLDLEVLPSQADTVRLPIALPFKRLMGEIQHLQKQDSVGITFDIRVVYSTWLGRASIPYKKTIMIAVPVPPKFEIEKLEYQERHKNVFLFNAHLKVINKGKLDLHISDLAYEVVVKDNFTAKGSDPREIHLAPASEQTVVLPIKVEFRHLFKTLVNIVTDKDQVNYHLIITGMAQMDKLSKEKTPVQIEKSGITELKK